MNQLIRTLQTIVDFSENTEIVNNSNAAQQDAENSITSADKNSMNRKKFREISVLISKQKKTKTKRALLHL